MPAKFTGGCACGAVRYEVEADPLMAGQCQCRDCQRSTGSGHASVMAFPEPAVSITGAVKFHDTKADSGNTASRGFCPDCGAPMVSKSSGMPGMLVVNAVTLDDPSRFDPQFTVYASRGWQWDHLNPALPKFETMPPAQG